MVGTTLRLFVFTVKLTTEFTIQDVIFWIKHDHNDSSKTQEVKAAAQ